MFDILTHVPTGGGISDHVVQRICAKMLKRLCLNAKEIERLEVCVLGCLNAHMLVCSHVHILVCSHD